MLQRAMAEIGHIDTDGHGISPRAAAYLLAAGVTAPLDGTSCPPIGGAFMAWLAIQDGMTPPVGAKKADAWMTWGDRLAHPTPGCVLVLTGDGGTLQHHVGVMLREAPGRYYVVEASRNVVAVRDYATNRVISARRPPTVLVAHAVPTQTTEPTTVNINVTVGAHAVDETDAIKQTVSSRLLPVSESPGHLVLDDVDAMKRRAVRAIAAVVESHRLDMQDPDRWVDDLASLAAEITTATTVEAIDRTIDRAKAYMTRGN